MKKFHMNLQLTKDGKKVVACAAAGVAVLALLLFFLLFRVSKVEVVGSTRYTDEEIRGYAMQSPLTTNTQLAVWFKSHMEAEDIPFVESFDLEKLDMHTIRIHVNEKKIVGYVIQGTDKLYFDKDGLVVEMESMTSEEITQLEAEGDELEELKAQAIQEEERRRAEEAEKALTGESGDSEDNEEEQDMVPQEEAQTLQAEEVNLGNEGATEFHAAVTDVPRVIGVTSGTVELGKKIETEDDSVFNTILGITRIVEKYQILPEMVCFDEDLQITLVYQQGNIHCKLGKDTLLEEKITRVAAILPKLEGLTGILHLEDYTADTTNIIFSKESLYTLKSSIAEIEGTIVSDDSAEIGDGSVPDAGMDEEGAANGENSEGTEGTANGETPEGTEGTANGETPEGTEGTANGGTSEGTEGTANGENSEGTDGTANGETPVE